MGVEHHLVLSMLLIVVSGAWSLVGTMRFLMLLVTLLLWFGHLLIADLCIREVWGPQTEALFDIRVVDTDARSYCARSPKDVLGTAEGEKKHKYLQACQDRRATFTPLRVSVDDMLGSEAEFFVRRLGDFLAPKWERPYSVVMGWVRARLSFVILRAALLCVRGS